MTKKLTVAFIGCGGFARQFVPLFKAHPYVEKVYVCDLIPERAQEYSRLFDVEIIGSFEEVLANEKINCIANFTQRHKHGPIVRAALEHGKHVYSAVPMASTVEDITEIIRLVKETRQIYMMGETCYYYPCAMFCRDAYEKGLFGDFCYGAAQYYHNIDFISYGKRPNESGMPPLLYPTHSTSMILSAAHSYAKKVVCFGYLDKLHDGRFGEGCNEWNNPYSSQYMMLQLANGGTVRVSEARSLGWKKPSSYISAVYGTKGGYEFSNAQHILVERDFSVQDEEEETMRLTDVSDLVNTEDMVAHKDLPDFKERVANGEWQGASMAKVQESERARLPQEYEKLENGHMGTHKFLVDDFCRAAYTGIQPVLNAWTCARYNLPGLVGIESCRQGGVPLDVPDFGDCPF